MAGNGQGRFQPPQALVDFGQGSRKTFGSGLGTEGGYLFEVRRGHRPDCQRRVARLERRARLGSRRRSEALDRASPAGGIARQPQENGKEPKVC